MAKAKRRKQVVRTIKRGPGRPRTRGETISVTFRLSRELSDRIERARKAATDTLTRTEAIERALAKGLDHV